jgi:hypothetical protein
MVWMYWRFINLRIIIERIIIELWFYCCIPACTELSAMWHPHQHHVIATWHPRNRHVTATSAPLAATSATNSSLQATWRVNPWRSLSSQILGFGLGSMGFTPIYDDLRTSWITLIYDENLRTSREGIRDAQYMTFSNFVIDVILWRNFDDPWRKLTAIDHEIFCSEIFASRCRERIATFIMEQVITARGKFHADETVWANIVFGD